MPTSPVAKLVALATVLLGALAALQGAGVLTGDAAAIVTAAVAVLNAVLGIATHQKVKTALRRSQGTR